MTNQTEDNGERRQFRLFLPKNDNISPNLERMLGKPVYDLMRDMQGVKQLKRVLPSGSIVQIARGEDVANCIISDANPRAIGVSGSDLALASALSGRYAHFHAAEVEGRTYDDIWSVSTETGQKYVDLTRIFGKLRNPDVPIFLFANDRTLKMESIGSFNDAPSFCVLGSNCSTYEQVIQRVIAERRSLTAVCEARYEPLALSLLERDGSESHFRYSLKTVTGATEGFLRQGGELDGADVGVEIGATFKTARANGLELYERVMPTFPVRLSCYGAGEKPLTWKNVLKEVSSQPA